MDDVTTATADNARSRPVRWDSDGNRVDFTDREWIDWLLDEREAMQRTLCEVRKSSRWELRVYAVVWFAIGVVLGPLL